MGRVAWVAEWRPSPSALMLRNGITMNFLLLAEGLLLLLAATAMASGRSGILNRKYRLRFPVNFQYKTYKAIDGKATIGKDLLLLVL